MKLLNRCDVHPTRFGAPAAALVAMLFLYAAPARADGIEGSHESPSTPNLLIFNPGDLIGGIVSAEYERALVPWFGLSFGLSVYSFRGAFTPWNHPSYVALVPEFGARFHFIQDAPGGLWVGPYVGAGYIAARYNSTRLLAFGYGLGAAVGYNFIIAEHFVFQIGAGTGFNDYGDGVEFAPRLRLGLGGVF